LPWENRKTIPMDVGELDRLFPTLKNQLFNTIFERLKKKKKLRVPIFINEQSFLWLKFEGFVLPRDENNFLVNTIICQARDKSGGSWIIDSKKQSILTNVSKTWDYLPVTKSDFLDYLQNKYPSIPTPDLEEMLTDEREKAVLTIPPLKVEFKTIAQGFKLLEIKEYKAKTPGIEKPEKRKAADGKAGPKKIYFKYLKKNQKISWTGPLHAIFGHEENYYGNFYIWEWLHLIHPEDRQFVSNFISQNHYEKNRYSFTYRVKNKGGQYLYIKNNVRIFYDSIRQEKGLTGTIKSIQNKNPDKENLKERNEVLIPSSEKSLIQQILHELSIISSSFYGKRLFEEINMLVCRKLDSRFCIIGNLVHGYNEMETLSICGLDKASGINQKQWHRFLNEELLPLEPECDFLIISAEKDKYFSQFQFLVKQGITSVIRLDLFDTKMNKIGTLCLLNDQPLADKAFYMGLLPNLRNWIGKELHRFRFENALQETNFMHDAILNGAAYAIIAVNQRFELILNNDKTLPLFNLKNKDQLLGTKMIRDGKTTSLLEVIINFSKSTKKMDYFLLTIGNDLVKELKLSITKIHYGNKKKVSYVMFIDDITDRNLSEKKLIASDQLYKSIAENFPGGAIDVLDKSFCYLFTDGEEYRLSGIDPNALIGTNYLEQYSGENLRITEDNLKKILKGKTVTYETEVNHQRFLQNGVPLMNNSKEIDRILLVKQNITASKKLESDREQLIKDLKSHNEELLRFAYIVSHNLRAPIVNISLLLDLYNEEIPADPENEEVLENLKISTNLLDATLQDLIEVVSIKKQKIPKVEHIDFKLLLNNIEKSLFNQLKESGIKIHKDFSQLNEINYVYAHLENFFMNFMTNAVKYKHPERSPVVKISTYPEKDYCVIRFEDNGIGLDLSRYGDRIFGLYQRFHNHVEGKGLGLYLVREQIRAHDGKIEIESEVGKGTVFKVYLRNLIINDSKHENTAPIPGD
jgi:signal transduction histidine kinase